MDKEVYFVYLDSLHESGVNMLGATPYLTAHFPELTESAARYIVVDWLEVGGLRGRPEEED